MGADASARRTRLKCLRHCYFACVVFYFHAFFRAAKACTVRQRTAHCIRTPALTEYTNGGCLAASRTASAQIYTNERAFVPQRQGARAKPMAEGRCARSARSRLRSKCEITRIYVYLMFMSGWGSRGRRCGCATELSPE
jgi:hypothetical protein